MRVKRRHLYMSTWLMAICTSIYQVFTIYHLCPRLFIIWPTISYLCGLVKLKAWFSLGQGSITAPIVLAKHIRICTIFSVISYLCQIKRMLASSESRAPNMWCCSNQMHIKFFPVGSLILLDLSWNTMHTAYETVTMSCPLVKHLWYYLSILECGHDNYPETQLIFSWYTNTKHTNN